MPTASTTKSRKLPVILPAGARQGSGELERRVITADSSKAIEEMEKADIKIQAAVKAQAKDVSSGAETKQESWFERFRRNPKQ